MATVRVPPPIRFFEYYLLASLLILLTLPDTACAENVPVDSSKEAPPSFQDGSNASEITPVLDLIREEESVTIAVNHLQPISEAPATVYVISDEDIRHSGATDLPTILRRVPGMEIIQMTGADFNVSVRGDNQVFANKILVLVDGRSIYVDVQGSVFWKTIPVSLVEIKRIEVVKGPIESLYGFNAFDGVINIITKSAQEMKGTTLQFGGGEFGTITSSAVHAGEQGKLDYRLSIGEDQNQQWADRDSLAFRAYKLNVKTDYALTSDSNFSVSGGFVDTNRFQGPVTDRATLNGKFTDGYVNAEYQENNFFLRGWWRRFDTDANFITHPGLAPFLIIRDRDGKSSASFTNNSYNVEAQHAIKFWPSNRFTYGLNYRHNSLSSTIIDQFSRENRFGLYVQDEWRLTDRLTFVGGARYDLHTEINPTLSPRAALLYRLADNHTFRAGVSVAFRPPTLLETNLDSRPLVFTQLGPVTTSGLPNSNLRPEKIVSYELGYQGWFLSHRLRLRTDLFFNHITDLIAVASPTATTSFNVNSGKGDIYGGEASAEFWLTTWLSGFANYSYQEINQEFSGRFKRGAPRFKYNFGLRGDWENGLSGEVTFHHYGSTTYGIDPTFAAFAPAGAVVPDSRVGSYNLLNIRMAYQFWQKKAEVAFTAFNALNDRHLEHPLGQTIGSRVMGWLTIRL